ncbi:MAG: DNA-3-methyladenine glycosylase II [Gammaproteobacteria bacterium]|jgi:DNA-3-methyladenine glycosylase II
MKVDSEQSEVLDQTAIRESLDFLASFDSELKVGLHQVGYPLPRIRPHGFKTLLSIIAGQQISTDAAAAIIGRLHKLIPDMTAANFIQVSGDELREAGLSWRKVEYATGLAEAMLSKSLDLSKLETQDNQQAIKSITELRGFGEWSAEIYLMFSLQRKDIFPAGDLALRIALQKLKGLPEPLSQPESRQLTDAWSPFRSAGSLFLWHYYRGAPS